MTDEALILRTLRVEAPVWHRFLATYLASSPDGAGPPDVEARLERAWAAVTGLVIGPRPCPPCPICREDRVEPFCGGPLPYGRCAACGHGVLLDGRADGAIYASPGYYEQKDASGSGYDGYAAERTYREAKGRALIERILAVVPARRLFEVGSGFGYTRRAAEGLGLTTMGCDPNPAACERARQLHGMDTIQGTLPIEGAATFDLVLYQFVLEHLPDPVAELARAGELLAPGGAVAVLVPSMDAAEARIFRGYYRSFRSDHLHLYSRRSLALAASRAGLTLTHVETGCNLHLLAPFLDPSALKALYRSGRGPDMLGVLFRGTPP